MTGVQVRATEYIDLNGPRFRAEFRVGEGKQWRRLSTVPPGFQSAEDLEAALRNKMRRGVVIAEPKRITA